MKSMFRSIENFRDMGGTPTTDGRHIKYGYFYRCGKLDKASKKAKKTINGFNLSKVFDFRDMVEIEEAPDFKGNFENIYAPALPPLDSTLASTKKAAKLLMTVDEETANALKKQFVDSYYNMPIGNDAYRKLLYSLNDHKPILYHCTSGKDRTGVAGILISLALGVSKEQALKDYLASNDYRKKDNQIVFWWFDFFCKNEIGRDGVRFLMLCQEAFFEAAYNGIFDKYKTFDEYLLKEYGITKEMTDDWKAFYLE